MPYYLSLKKHSQTLEGCSKECVSGFLCCCSSPYDNTSLDRVWDIFQPLLAIVILRTVRSNQSTLTVLEGLDHWGPYSPESLLLTHHGNDLRDCNCLTSQARSSLRRSFRRHRPCCHFGHRLPGPSMGLPICRSVGVLDLGSMVAYIQCTDGLHVLT